MRGILSSSHLLGFVLIWCALSARFSLKISNSFCFLSVWASDFFDRRCWWRSSGRPMQRLHWPSGCSFSIRIARAQTISADSVGARPFLSPYPAPCPWPMPTNSYFPTKSTSGSAVSNLQRPPYFHPFQASSLPWHSIASCLWALNFCYWYVCLSRLPSKPSCWPRSKSNY